MNKAFTGWTVYGQQMVLDDLGSSLRGTLDKLQGKTRLSEEDVEEVVKIGRASCRERV